jgi:multisubunit Na+/H+ antiporter MnhB subunit
MIFLLVGAGIVFALATILLVMNFRKKHDKKLDMILVIVMLYLTALLAVGTAFRTG